MFRLYGPVLLALAVLGLWLWTILDVIATPESDLRRLPKAVWLMLVIFFGPVGSLVYLLLGRPEPAPTAPEGALHAAPGASAEEARRRRYAELDAELDRRIEERRRREAGAGDPGPDELGP